MFSTSTTMVLMASTILIIVTFHLARELVAQLLKRVEMMQYSLVLSRTTLLGFPRTELKQLSAMRIRLEPAKMSEYDIVFVKERVKRFQKLLQRSM